MDKRIIEAVAVEINKVLNMNPMVVFSWGVESRTAMEFRGMPALKLKVNGFLHKGDVVIALNEGADLYEVYLLDGDGSVKSEHKDVYADMLTGVIDRLVETDNDKSEEYSRRVEEFLRM